MGCKPSTNANNLDSPADAQESGGGGWKGGNHSDDVRYTDVETDKSMVILREEKGMNIQGVGAAANQDLKQVGRQQKDKIDRRAAL